MTTVCRILGRIAGSETPVIVEVDTATGRVAAVRAARPGSGADAGGPECVFCPPLVDGQVNGAFGLDLQDEALRPADVLEISRRLARNGVGCWLPTLVTAPLEAMEHRCRVIAQAAAFQTPEDGARIGGIHLEGPFISPEDGARGAHPAAHVRPPSPADMRRLLRAGEGSVRCVTLAPERPGAARLIRLLVSEGVVASLGHHLAAPAEVFAAADAGATLCTHLGNGLPAMIPRHDNPLWAQLADPRLAVSLIPDLFHLPPHVLEVVFRVRGRRGTLLVSDAVNLAGMPAGDYALFGQPVEKRRDGKVALKGTDYLAGSGLMLLEGVMRAVRRTRIPLPAALACASAAPAAVLGLRCPPWRPAPGRPAHFLLVDPGMAGKAPTPETFLRAVFLRGRTVTAPR
ncbi:MAG: N-acetylglucosamine-6-phosphate deacetylase [Candidatus Hydrogenedentes bacterium]|mgnify:CR=1 FL=1|nr:N-acetylglucosamine-6-phosphate deacetylase [Candidatus Hydrogenedentota bacterium]